MKKTMTQLFGPVILLLTLAGIVTLGSLTLLGKKTSQVFSQINSGLTGGEPIHPALSKPHPKPDVGMHSEPSPRDFDDASDEGDERAIPHPQGQPAAPKAGERDDNEDFAAYLDYVQNYNGPRALPIDIRDRTIIQVMNQDQQPLQDATVSFYESSQLSLGTARTYAGGKTLFHPYARGASAQTNTFRMVVRYEQQEKEMLFRRGAETVQVVLEDARPPEQFNLDILFLLDTTGSMDDELARLQQTIDSIAQRIDTFTPRPSIRFGLVAYRDEAEEYVTRKHKFTSDVETFRTLLNGFSAEGGGDVPEALNEGLHESVQRMEWRESAIRLIFLVSDAGPHVGESEQYDYRNEIQQAVSQGIKVYPIAASGTDEFAEYVFRQLAQQTLARFIFLTYQAGQESGVPGESTTLQAGDAPYVVDRLDDLIVQVVQQELALASGKS
jgi:Mg-chelatase subunit ChlD